MRTPRPRAPFLTRALLMLQVRGVLVCVGLDPGGLLHAVLRLLRRHHGPQAACARPMGASARGACRPCMPKTAATTDGPAVLGYLRACHCLSDLSHAFPSCSATVFCAEVRTCCVVACVPAAQGPHFEEDVTEVPHAGAVEMLVGSQTGYVTASDLYQQEDYGKDYGTGTPLEYLAAGGGAGDGEARSRAPSDGKPRSRAASADHGGGGGAPAQYY